MTPGQKAYQEDVIRKPLYHDGYKRRTWDQLPAWAQGSWERNPTPNTYAKGDLIAFNTPQEITA